MFAAFLHPLGLAHAFFPVFEMWYLPGVNKSLDTHDTMVAKYFRMGTFSSMMQVDFFYFILFYFFIILERGP